jgi:hypothetical protein
MSRHSAAQSLISGSLLHSRRTNRFLSHRGWEGGLDSLRDGIDDDPAAELPARFVQQILRSLSRARHLHTVASVLLRCGSHRRSGAALFGSPSCRSDGTCGSNRSATQYVLRSVRRERRGLALRVILPAVLPAALLSGLRCSHVGPHRLDRHADPFRVRSLVQIRQQLAQTRVVEFYGIGPQIVHFHDFTEKRVE